MHAYLSLRLGARQKVSFHTMRSKWAASCANVSSGIYGQRCCWSACSTSQSDQGLSSPLTYTLWQYRINQWSKCSNVTVDAQCESESVHFDMFEDTFSLDVAQINTYMRNTRTVTMIRFLAWPGTNVNWSVARDERIWTWRSAVIASQSITEIYTRKSKFVTWCNAELASQSITELHTRKVKFVTWCSAVIASQSINEYIHKKG